LKGKCMKLFFCPECEDVIRMFYEIRHCRCQKAFGRYIDDLNAEIGGTAIPLGFANSSFVNAIKWRSSRKNDTWGIEFRAFVIPEKCDTITVVNEDSDG